MDPQTVMGKGFPLSEAFSLAKHAACREHVWKSEGGRGVDSTTGTPTLSI